MQFPRLLAVTIAAWILHVILVTSYTKLFSDTHGVVFRIIYALELTATFSFILWFYLKRQPTMPALPILLLTVIGYLALVDTALSLTVASVHKTFDVWHFAAAYSLLALSLTGLYKLLVE